MRCISSIGIGLILLVAAAGMRAQETPLPTAPEAPSAASELAEHEAEFRDRLTGSRWVGFFTMGDQEGTPKLQADRYEIVSVERLPGSDLWLFTARIQYGDKDITIPMPLPVKWAGTTPVITLDHLTIPGLGTFDARVVISGDRYAGTWQHGAVGGHLFGRIEKVPEKDEP